MGEGNLAKLMAISNRKQDMAQEGGDWVVFWRPPVSEQDTPQEDGDWMNNLRLPTMVIFNRKQDTLQEDKGGVVNWDPFLQQDKLLAFERINCL